MKKLLILVMLVLMLVATVSAAYQTFPATDYIGIRSTGGIKTTGSHLLLGHDAGGYSWRGAFAIYNISASGTVNSCILELTTGLEFSSGNQFYAYNFSSSWSEGSTSGIGYGDTIGSQMVVISPITANSKENTTLSTSICQQWVENASNSGLFLKNIYGESQGGDNEYYVDKVIVYMNFSAPVAAFSWEPPTPEDGAKNNTITGITFNASCTTGGVSAWWNNTIVLDNASSPAAFSLNSSITPGDGTYSYLGSCDSGATNSTARTWILDTTEPAITLNPSNSFTQANVTANPFAQDLQLNFSLQDNNALYAFLVNITHPNGTTMYYIQNETLTSATYTFEHLEDVSAWPGVNYSVEITASDSHTINKIKDYKVTKPFGGGKLVFETAEGNTINIETDLLAKMDATKKGDRYEFSVDYLGGGTKTRTFQVKSNNPITYFPNSTYKAHFVVGSATGGNWIDFEGLPCTPTVTKISDYHYNVKCSNVPDKVTLHSIGGLNTNTQNFIYSRNTLSLDSVTISPSTPVTANTLQGFATASSGQNDLINYSWRWYANGTLYDSGYKVDYNASINLANISSSVTNIGSSWIFSAMLTAAGNSTPWINSSTATVAFQVLNMSVFDESTGSYLLQNVTILISSDSYERTQYTSTGTATASNLVDGLHQITFSADNYSVRTYTLTLSNATQNLNAYLAPDTSDLTFTVKDQNNGEFLENVLSTQYRIINNSWIPVESKYTDITGRIVFSYVSGVKYRFIMAKTSYETNTFELNPVVFNSYDVYLNPTSTVDATHDYDRVAIVYSPQEYIEGNNTFLWIISNPFGELTSYGYTLYYPGGTSASSGSNAQGSQLTSLVNISGATFGDRVQLDMFYISTVAGSKNFTIYFPINLNQTGSGVISANQDNHYGLGLFERILIMVITVLFVTGIATLIGRPLEGFGLGLLMMGWFVWIGFISIWSIMVSLIAGIIIISARSSD